MLQLKRREPNSHIWSPDVAFITVCNWDLSFSLGEDETLSLCGEKKKGPNAWRWVSEEEPGRTLRGGVGIQAHLEIHTWGA